MYDITARRRNDLFENEFLHKHRRGWTGSGVKPVCPVVPAVA